MTKPTNNYFAQLYDVNVTEHLEKKGPYSYLSWPYAVAKLRLFDPSSTWEVKRFNGLPYLQTDLGYFVEASVTVQGVTLSQIHPVLNARNQPILTPSSFDINTSIQRALVKAIALHGLGLSVYAGEDLPDAAEVVGLSEQQQAHIRKLVTEQGGDMSKLLSFFHVQSLDQIPGSEFERVIRSLQRRKGNGQAHPAAEARDSRVAGTQKSA